MRVVTPLEFDSSMILSSTVDEIEYVEWSSGDAPYSKGTYVDYDYKIYRSAIDDNNDDPEGFLEGVNASPPTWVYMGQSNYVRAFTGGRDSVTTKVDGDLVIDIFYGEDALMETVGLLNVVGDAVTVEIIENYGEVNETIVATRTSDVSDYSVPDIYDYYYAPYSFKRDHIFQGIPPYIGAVMRITVSGAGGTTTTSLGRIVVGLSNFVGTTDYDTTVGRKRYTRYDRDGFGNLTITPRRNTKKAVYEVTIENTDIDSVQSYFDKIDSTPTLFIGTDEPDTGYEDSLNVFGIFNDFDISIDYFEISRCSITVEGY